MKLKTLIVSVAILVVISAIVFIAQRPAPPPSKDPRIGQPLLDRTIAEKAAKVQVSDQGKKVEVVRQSDGTWQDASYYDMPADFMKISGLLSAFTDGKIDRFVTATPERLNRLEFKDTKVVLLDGANKPLWSITLGKSAETGSGRFVRFDDEEKAYLAALSVWIDADAKNWANGDLLKLKPEEIAKVEIEFPGAAPVTLTRANKGAAWTAEKTPANEKVKADRVTSLLNYVGNIHFNDTKDLTDPTVAAAKAHERSVKLTTFDGKTYTVALGRKPEEKKLKAPASAAKPEPEKKGEKAPEKKAEPEYETIPAGPVYVFISSSDASAPVNAEMKKRAFEVGDYTYTALPAKADDLFEPAPPAPAKAPDKVSAATKPAESGVSPTPPPPAVPATPAKK